MRSHSVRHFAVNPRRRRRRGSRRRRNPGFFKEGMSIKRALPIVAIGGTATAAALYVGAQTILKYPGKTSTATAAIAAGVGLAAGVAAAAIAGPVAGIMVFGTLAGVAISAIRTPSLPAGTGMTTAGIGGYRAMQSRNIPQLGMVLADDLRGYRPMGTILTDDMRGIRGIGSFGAGPRVRGRYNDNAEVSRIISELGGRE
jgi:hypothetical protein